MWKLKASDRMVHWRDFRKTLDKETLEKSLELVARFWQGCPFVPFYLDQDSSVNWPDPWTLIYENTYCDLAKALGIVYTMHLTKFGKDLNSEVRIYENPETKHRYNLACFGKGKYILNLIDSQVVNIEQVDKLLKLVRQYSATELKLEQY